MSDIAKQIGFKEKRREQLTNVHNYGECEKISDEISSLKRKRFELQAELTKLKRRQQQSAWYKKQRKASLSHVTFDISDTDTNAPSTSPSPSIQSSRPNTPLASPFSPQSPTQIASSNPSNEQISLTEGQIIVLSEQEESSAAPRDTISKHGDIELLSNDSDSPSNL